MYQASRVTQIPTKTQTNSSRCDDDDSCNDDNDRNDDDVCNDDSIIPLGITLLTTSSHFSNSYDNFIFVKKNFELSIQGAWSSSNSLISIWD